MSQSSIYQPHYSFRVPPAMPPKSPAKPIPRMTEAQMGKAWLKLLADERAKKSLGHEKREMNRTASMTDNELHIYKRRRAVLQFIAGIEETGTGALYRFSNCSEAKARHDADTLANARLISSDMRGRSLVYAITPEGRAWLETAGELTPFRSKTEANQ